MTDARSGRMLATALIVVVIAAGCVVGPDFKQPTAGLPDHYSPAATSDGQSSPAGVRQQWLSDQGLNGDWWLPFNSAALNALVAQAVQNNRTLAAAAARFAESEELARAKSGSLAPAIGMRAGVGRQKYGAEFLGTLPKPPPFTYFSVGPTISYVLDYTGGAARSVEQQFALADYERQQQAAAHLAVTGSVVMLSFTLASVRQQIDTVQSMLEHDRENLKLVHVAFDAGSVSRIDIVSAETQLASDATLLPSLRQQWSVTSHALALVLGQTSMDGMKLPELAEIELPKSIPISVPSELAHRRPDILAAESQLHAATAAVGVATSNLYPQIVLNGSIGMQSTVFRELFDGASNASGITAALSAPLFDGGMRRAQRRAAVAALRASKANYEQTVLSAFAQVADALDALEHDAEQLDAEAAAQAAAHSNVDLVRQSYNEGNAGVLQILDAERLYQRARLGVVRANAQRYLDTAQLFLALGGSATTAGDSIGSVR